MKYLRNVSSIRTDPAACTGCGLCIDVCPHNVLTLVNGMVTITDQDRCMECGACMNNCAFGAVSVDRGVGCAFALINSMLYGGEPSCDCSSTNSSDRCC